MRRSPGAPPGRWPGQRAPAPWRAMQRQGKAPRQAAPPPGVAASHRLPWRVAGHGVRQTAASRPP
eukprot:13403931-Heterocapsa_arctica.AAC.1